MVRLPQTKTNCHHEIIECSNCSFINGYNQALAEVAALNPAREELEERIKLLEEANRNAGGIISDMAEETKAIVARFTARKVTAVELEDLLWGFNELNGCGVHLKISQAIADYINGGKE